VSRQFSCDIIAHCNVIFQLNIQILRALDGRLQIQVISIRVSDDFVSLQLHRSIQGMYPLSPTLHADSNHFVLTLSSLFHTAQHSVSKHSISTLLVHTRNISTVSRCLHDLSCDQRIAAHQVALEAWRRLAQE
jgi:hypothetical protein